MIKAYKAIMVGTLVLLAISSVSHAVDLRPVPGANIYYYGDGSGLTNANDGVNILFNYITNNGTSAVIPTNPAQVASIIINNSGQWTNGTTGSGGFGFYPNKSGWYLITVDGYCDVTSGDNVLSIGTVMSSNGAPSSVNSTSIPATEGVDSYFAMSTYVYLYGDGRTAQNSRNNRAFPWLHCVLTNGIVYKALKFNCKFICY